MIPKNLVHALAQDISLCVNDYKFVAELQPPKKVSVYEQYLPRERFEQDSYYPLVIVSCRQVEAVDRETRLATMLLTLGVYGGDDLEGWEDLFNMAERISHFLIVNPIIAKRYPRETLPIFEPLADQPVPFYFGNIVLKYAVAMPQLGRVDDAL